MTGPQIPTLGCHDSAADLNAALGEAGAVVVTGVFDEANRSEVMDELAPHVARARLITRDDPDRFYPGFTRRVGAAFARSTRVRELARHPLAKSACEHFLLPNCERYQLHVASALVVGPGARAQVLHREDDGYPFFSVPRPHLIVASMWSVSPFTRDNGATLIVPGSHRWPAGREAMPDEVVSAVMPAGAVLLWLGGTLHGAGANVSADDWRYGVFVSFSLGWLRQEENQYLDVPAQVVNTLDDELKSLIGYEMHRGLGFFDPAVRDGSV